MANATGGMSEANTQTYACDSLDLARSTFSVKYIQIALNVRLDANIRVHGLVYFQLHSSHLNKMAFAQQLLPAVGRSVDPVLSRRYCCLRGRGFSFRSSASFQVRRRRTSLRMADGKVEQRQLLSKADDIEWFREPVLVRGKVQRGFGRGSRKLGTPTANLPGFLLDGNASTARNGVYVGFGYVPSLMDSPVEMVANLGRNITFDDVPARVLEAYLMDDTLAEEFYGEEMRLCIGGFLRPEVKFDGLDALIANIRNDIEVTAALLADPRARRLARYPPLLVP
jgi:riboflavin kinase